MLFAAGVGFLMFTFGGSVAAVLRWAFPRGPAPVDDQPRPAAVVSGRAPLPTMASEPRVVRKAGHLVGRNSVAYCAICRGTTEYASLFRPMRSAWREPCDKC